jgi:hypothetical protein
MNDTDDANAAFEERLAEHKRREEEARQQQEEQVRRGNGGRKKSWREEAESKPGSPPSDASDPITRLVDDFNRKYLVVNENGKAIIYASRHDPIQNRRFFDRMSFDDLTKLYLNRYITTGKNEDGAPIRKRVAPLWLNHSQRRQYLGGVVFDPSHRTPDDVLNLWQGFAVEPRAGDWSLLREHIVVVICNRDTAAGDYLLNWLADLVQNPAKQGEVAGRPRGVRQGHRRPRR